MDEPYKQFFLSYLFGLSSMTYFHNFFVSVFLYRSGIANVTNILKIIFNLSGTTWSIIRYSLIMIPLATSIYHCKALIYLEFFMNFFYREALAAFLLWRLKQIDYSTWDQWISFALFTFRTLLNLTLFGFSQPFISTYSINTTTFSNGGSIDVASVSYLPDCEPGLTNEGKYIQLGCISTDLIIDIFVTIRLVQILNEGNRNAAQANSIIGRRNPKRTLFTAVLYWNFMRLTIDFLYNVIEILNILGPDRGRIYFEVLNGIQCFAIITQSYLITVDAEIVKVIEGNQNRNIVNDNDNDNSGNNGDYNNNNGRRYRRNNNNNSAYNVSCNLNNFTDSGIGFDRSHLSLISFRNFLLSSSPTSREMEEGERDMQEISRNHRSSLCDHKKTTDYSINAITTSPITMNNNSNILTCNNANNNNSSCNVSNNNNNNNNNNSRSNSNDSNCSSSSNNNSNHSIKSRRSLKSMKSSFSSHTTNTSGSKSPRQKSWKRDSLSRQQKTASFRLDKNKFVVVSMQRLTFFEWANLITSGEDEEDESIEHCDTNNNNNNDCDDDDKYFYENSNKYYLPPLPPTPIQYQNNNSQSLPKGDKKEGIALRSSDEVMGLLDNCDPPAMVHISQSRRGSSTSTIMTNSTSQTKINDQFTTDIKYKQSFI